MAMNCPFFGNNILLLNSYTVSIDAVYVNVSQSYSNISPPIVNYTQYKSSFSGLISRTDLLYIAVPFFGACSLLIQ